METNIVHMKDYSSLKIGGEGDLVVVRGLQDVVTVSMKAKSNGKLLIPLGEGTNTYFGNNLDSYLFLKNEIKGISFEEKDDAVFLTACAGEVFDDIILFSVSKNLWGIENLSFIPGTVGAAPVQNIGAYGTELKDTLVYVTAYDTQTLNTVEISNEACDFGYRSSLFKKEKNRYIILSITLKLSKTKNPVLAYKPLDTLSKKENIDISDVRDLVIATRKAKLPDYKIYPNTGSFFKNPIVTKAEGGVLRTQYENIPLLDVEDGYKIPAAWLIEHVAEMKGVRVGDVGTWPNQPLVIVNYGVATCEELEHFVHEIIEKISKKTGVCIEKEVNFVE